MTNLDRYLRRTRDRQSASAVAARAGVTSGMLSEFRSGKRRPSPDVAKRIEAATAGEVTAASLLGVAGGDVRKRRDGKWVVEIGEDGRAHLPAELLAEFGIAPGEPLVLSRTDLGFQANSMWQGVRRMQESTRGLLRPGESIVDELIAERRIEASRE